MALGIPFIKRSGPRGEGASVSSTRTAPRRATSGGEQADKYTRMAPDYSGAFVPGQSQGAQESAAPTTARPVRRAQK